MWHGLEGTLTDLPFLEGKVTAGMTFELVKRVFPHLRKLCEERGGGPRSTSVEGLRSRGAMCWRFTWQRSTAAGRIPRAAGRATCSVAPASHGLPFALGRLPPNPAMVGLVRGEIRPGCCTRPRCGSLGERHLRDPQHFLNFLPLPQGQGSLRPTRRPSDDAGAVASSVGSRAAAKCGGRGGGVRR